MTTTVKIDGGTLSEVAVSLMKQTLAASGSTAPALPDELVADFAGINGSILGTLSRIDGLESSVSIGNLGDVSLQGLFSAVRAALDAWEDEVTDMNEVIKRSAHSAAVIREMGALGRASQNLEAFKAALA